MHTATKLGNRAARHFKLDDSGKTRMQRIFRNMVAKAVIPTTADEDDERGTLLFDDNAAAVALLLFPLAALETDARGLRGIANYCLGLGFGQRPIERALKAAKNGKAVTLVTTLAYDDGEGFRRLTRFEIEGDGPTGKAKEIVDDYKSAIGQPLAETRIPANILLAPLLVD
jgi:hypothetical protein